MFYYALLSDAPFVIIEFCYTDSVTLYTFLAGVCLWAHLLLCVESLPLRMPTTTESPPISSDVDSNEATAGSPPENPDQAIVPSHQDPASFLTQLYDILTVLNQQPTPRPDSEQPRADSNLPVTMVSSSSTTGLSEENLCSSKAIQPGPCRKRSASTDELAEKVFSHMMGMGDVKRMKEENPPASTSNLPTPNPDELPVGETSSHSTDSQQQRDSGSSSSSDSDESTSSSSESPSTTSTQPTTRNM